VKDGTVAAIDDSRPHRYRSFGVAESLPETLSGGMAKSRRAGTMPCPAGGTVKRSLAVVRTDRATCAVVARRRWGQFIALLLLISGSGCAERVSTFEIVDYRDGGDAKRYRETFDEAYYDLDDQGNVNIVLRRTGGRSGAGESEVTQIVSIRGVWRPVAGKTGSNGTQINATVSYYIVGGRVGDTFEGAGSVFFTQNRKKNTLSGTLDRAVLRPKRQIAPGEPLFGRTELSGEFRAARDRRQVVRIMNEADRLFGPLPSQ